MNGADKAGGADVLLICGNFFGYPKEIVRQLEARGRKVAWFEDRPATDSLTKAAIRLAPRLVAGRADAYFRGIITQMRGQPIRDVLVIKGEALSPAAIRDMRAAFPGARFTLYFWDSYRNMPADSHVKVGLFDRALSFDPGDVQDDLRLRYRPLFFVESFARVPDLARDIDILFVGTMHGDRFKVVQRLARALPPDVRFRHLLYFPARWLFGAHTLCNPGLMGAKADAITFTPKSRAELAEMVGRSHAVLDIERPVQAGFTMRTLEVLGAGRKLITTNAEVAKADFYDPANIAVIDRKTPRLPAGFLTTPFRPVAPDILYRYSIAGWLDEILSPA